MRADGIAMEHPIKIPVDPPLTDDEVLAIASRRLDGRSTHEDFIRQGYRRCLTPRPEPRCRCGAYAIDWNS